MKRVWMPNIGWLLLGSFVILMFVLPPATTGGAWDNIPTALLPVSLLREGNFDLNEFREAQAMLKGGEAYYFLSVNQRGEVIGNYPPFNAVLVTPIYALGALFQPNLLQQDSLFTPDLAALNRLWAVILSLLTAWLLYQTLRDTTQSESAALLGAFVFIFTTPVLSITAREVWQHTTALLWITLALRAFLKKQFLPFVLMSALAVLCRPTSAALLLPMGYALLWRSVRAHRPLIRWSRWDIGCLLLIMALVAFQVWYAGRYLQFTSLFAPQYSLGRFVGNPLQSLPSILFSPSRGIFFYCGFFLLGLLFAVRHWRQQPDLAIISLSCLMHILLISKWEMWHTGDSYRLLVEMVSLLSFLFAVYWASVKPKRWRFAALVFLIAWSVSLQAMFPFWSDCGFYSQPIPIDALPPDERFTRLWTQSPLQRCLETRIVPFFWGDSR